MHRAEKTGKFMHLCGYVLFSRVIIMIQFMLIYFSSTVKQNNLCLFITLNPETNKQ